MSDNTPLWSDLKIDKAALKELNDYGTMTLFTAKRLFHHMRDDYEAELAKLRQQIVASYKRESEVELAWAEAVSQLAEGHERVAELEAQLAGSESAVETFEDLMFGEGDDV